MRVDRPAIDANYKVVPRFNWDVLILVAEDLETEGFGICARVQGLSIRVKAGNKSIQSSKHCEALSYRLIPGLKMIVH